MGCGNRTIWRSRTRRAALVAALSVSGRGARTALTEPCVIPLRRERPIVVYLVDWAGGCERWRGTR